MTSIGELFPGGQQEGRDVTRGESPDHDPSKIDQSCPEREGGKLGWLLGVTNYFLDLEGGKRGFAQEEEKTLPGFDRRHRQEKKGGA